MPKLTFTLMHFARCSLCGEGNQIETGEPVPTEAGIAVSMVAHQATWMLRHEQTCKKLKGNN